jgi:hypothetical protein
VLKWAESIHCASAFDTYDEIIDHISCQAFALMGSVWVRLRLKLHQRFLIPLVIVKRLKKIVF